MNYIRRLKQIFELDRKVYREMGMSMLSFYLSLDRDERKISRIISRLGHLTQNLEEKVITTTERTGKYIARNPLYITNI